VESSCECGNEPSGSINCWETIEWLHSWWPLELVSSRKQPRICRSMTTRCNLLLAASRLCHGATARPSMRTRRNTCGTSQRRPADGTEVCIIRRESCHVSNVLQKRAAEPVAGINYLTSSGRSASPAISATWRTLANPVTVNPDGNMENEKCCSNIGYFTWPLGRQITHLSVQTELDSFFDPAFLQLLNLLKTYIYIYTEISYL
jgi:hypothetical protein